MFNSTPTKGFSQGNETGMALERPYKIVEVVLIVLGLGSLSLITVIGNILVMLSIKVNRNLQTVNNYFLFSLACADLIIGLFSMNLYTLYIVIGYWPLGPFICDLWLALDYAVSNASVMNLLIISFDRYFCVTKPLSYPVSRTTKMAGVMIAVAWVLSFVLWAPAILFWQFMVGVRTVPEGVCYIQFFSNAAVTFGTAIAAFYLPVVTMMVLYWQISKASRSRMQRRDSRRASAVSQDEERGGRGQVAATTMGGVGGCGARMPSQVAADNDVSTSGSALASSNHRDGEEAVPPETNGDAQPGRLKPSPPGKAKLSWPQLGCIKAAARPSPEDHHKPAANAKEEPVARSNRPSLVSQKLLEAAQRPLKRKRRRSMSSRERKVTRTIMAILVAFVATWTPYNVMVLINTFCSSCIPSSMWIIGYWLCYINSTVNPACYALCNVTFKNTFKHLLLCQYKNIRSAR